MSFSRRDTIIIAVLMNLGLLSVLLMTALHMDEEAPKEAVASPQNVVAIEPQKQEKALAPAPVVALASTPHDEVDRAIQQQAPIVAEVAASPQSDTIEITVKKGDALEKIARANGTTIRELRRLNDLNSDKLSIGQKLKVPARRANLASQKEESGSDTIYVVQTGDNPWKIARKFQVRYDDILTWNNLDEEKARNLRPGDKVRIK